MRLLCILFSALLPFTIAKDCNNIKKSTSKLFCYYSKLNHIDDCYCTHIILPANSDIKSVERVREIVKESKILITVNEFNQGLIDLLKTNKVDGLEVKLTKLTSKNDINDFISTVRSKLGSDLYLALSVPANPETLAKYYDFKGLHKYTDSFILQTAFLGASRNVTFHPSRLSGLWDMQNADSMVDLVGGLGVPLSKLVIAIPVQAYHFTLQNGEYSAPGSPALELKSLSRDQFCDEMKNGVNWTMERDEDQAGPYIFSGNQWIAFEDTSSIYVKTKYSRVRGLAGLALKDLSQDGGKKCGQSILEIAFNGLSKQARAPRAALLHTLEREIVETPTNVFQGINLSPYRITRIIDVEGHWHVIRQDTRTEFTCSRQGYFVHPRSCNRFYRCVKFDQLSDEYNVFEFDCPAGLAFDERVEVCVWPGSLPQGQPCSGSSEIAPVPRQRFACPSEQGYYADPENCRWFFACLDHGKSALEAYEFRCPFGLVFDVKNLLCEWPWLVPKCNSGTNLGINVATEYYYGGISDTATGLNQYDGLGTLGVVKFGDYTGQIQQPIIYSNVGLRRFNNVELNSYNKFGLGNLGSTVTETLHSAGLLQPTATVLIDQNINSDHRSNDNFSGLSTGINYNLNNNNVEYASVVPNSVQFNHDAYNSDLRSFSNRNNNHNGGKAINYFIADSNAFSQANKVNPNVEIYYEGIKSENNKFVAGQKAIIDPTINYLNVVNNDNAQFQHQQSAISHNINIIGGGYSAVSESSSSLGITSTPYFEIIPSTTPRPISVSTIASVPIVTSVPVPILNRHTNFEGYNGGVVANIPELQYKAHGETGFVNISRHFISSTTPTVATTKSFEYNKPDIVIINDGYPEYYNRAIQKVSKDNLHSNFNTGASFSYQSQQYDKNGGYVYPKPNTVFEEGQYLNYNDLKSTSFEQDHFREIKNDYTNNQQIPYIKTINYEQKQVTQPIVFNEQISQHDTGYVYSKPSIPFEETPSTVFVKQNDKVVVPVITQQIEQKTVIQPSVSVLNQQHTGYNYDKPDISFDETPAVYTHSTHIINKEKLLPIISTQSIKSESLNQEKEIIKPLVSVQQDSGYFYPKPTVPFDENPQGLSHSIFSKYLEKTIQPGVAVEAVAPVQRVATYQYFPSTTAKPIVAVEAVAPVQQVHTYQYVPSITAKPVVAVEAVAPVQRVDTYQYVPSTTAKPFILTEFQNVVKPTVSNAPINLTFYSEGVSLKPNVFVSSTVAPVQSHSFAREYEYPKPVLPLNEPTAQRYPAKIISRFTIRNPQHLESSVSAYGTLDEHIYDGYHYEKPEIKFREEPVQLPVLVKQQPTLPTSVVPEFTEQIFPVNSLQSTWKPTVVAPYFYQKPSVTSYTYKDVVQSTTPNTIVPAISTYSPITEKPLFNQQVVNVRPITVTTATPTFYNLEISKIKNQPDILVNQPEVGGYHYPKPSVKFVEQPKQVVNIYQNEPVEETDFIKKKSYITTQNYEIKKPLVPTGPVIIEDYKAPFLVTNNYEYRNNLFNSQANTNSFKDLKVNSVSSTSSPNVFSTYSKITPTIDVSKFQFYDSRFSTTSKTSEEYYNKPQIKEEFVSTPVVVVTSPTKDYLPATSTTSKPIARYSFSSLNGENTHSSSYASDSTIAYEPIRTKVQYTTVQPSYSENYLPVKTASTVPTTFTKEYLPVRSENIAITRRPTKVVKVVRPFKTVIKQNDFIPLLSTKLGAQCTCTSNTLNLRKKQKVVIIENDDDDDNDGYEVENDNQGTIIENYKYEPQKNDEIASTSQANVESTVKITDKISNYPTSRRIRPLKPVVYTTVEENILNEREKDESSSDKEIVQAVRTGLKLVKQAAKEGAKEGTEEIINKYNSRIRETIECQRAGLFRHPNHCNKFYACRWDCTKNKYTLHTFNCPIHLTFDNSLGACNWPSQGPACTDNTLLPTA